MVAIIPINFQQSCKMSQIFTVLGKILGENTILQNHTSIMFFGKIDIILINFQVLAATGSVNLSLVVWSICGLFTMVFAFVILYISLSDQFYDRIKSIRVVSYPHFVKICTFYFNRLVHTAMQSWGV